MDTVTTMILLLNKTPETSKLMNHKQVFYKRSKDNIMKKLDKLAHMTKLNL